MMVYSIHVSVLLYKRIWIYTHNKHIHICISSTAYMYAWPQVLYQEAYLNYHIVGGVGALPICTGEPCVTFIKLICTGEQPRVTFIKLISPVNLMSPLISSSLTCYKGNYEGAHVHPVDHHGATWGTNWALGPRSVDYWWTQQASKEECDCLQYTQKLTSYYEQYRHISVLPYKWLCIHTINTYTHIIDSTYIHVWSHIYIYTYTYILGRLSHLFHSGWRVCEGHYPFCICIALLHLYYPFALVLPICTCITHYLHLHYPFALTLPFCTWITHLHLHYPFALALPTYLHLHYPFVILFALPITLQLQASITRTIALLTARPSSVSF